LVCVPVCDLDFYWKSQEQVILHLVPWNHAEPQNFETKIDHPMSKSVVCMVV